MNNADQVEARAILQGWMAENKITQSQLAKRAGLNRSIVSRFLKGSKLDADSALKIYTVVGQNLDPIHARTFLKSVGLLSLASTIGSTNVTVFQPEEESLTFGMGMRLFVKGMDVAHYSYEEAIPIFFQAERAFGPASTLAARAACEAVQQLISLGEYERAEQEVRRVQNSYGHVIDPETEARLSNVAGWLHYYKGNLDESKKRFENCLRIAQLTGVERLGDGANHFLGKICCAYGQLNLQRADLYFQEADYHFRVSFLSSLKRGGDDGQAFELFRHSQLFQVRGDFQEAKYLRAKSHQMFGKSFGIFHVAIAEAKLALEEGEIKAPKLKAEEALKAWAQEKYSRGMSSAVGVLALADFQSGKFDQAFELSIISLCLYPPESLWKIQELWNQVEYINQLLLSHKTRNEHLSFVRRIYDLAQEQRNYFSYLNRATGKRDEFIAQIFSCLGTNTAPSFAKGVSS